jgi:Metallo-beta-lactamase superfamily
VTGLTIAPGGSASVYVLHEGYVGRDGDDERVAGTVTLIMDGGAVIVVDPGMVASRAALLAALAAHGPNAGDVTDVVFSHHHPDHTVNAALFPAARIHDHWAMYVGTGGSTATRTGWNSGLRSGCCARRGTPPRTSPRWRPPRAMSSLARTRGGALTDLPRTRSALIRAPCTPAGNCGCRSFRTSCPGTAPPSARTGTRRASVSPGPLQGPDRTCAIPPRSCNGARRAFTRVGWSRIGPR